MRNLLLAAAVVIAGLCFANTAQAQWGCPPGYGGYGGGYYRAPVNTYYRGGYGYGYVPRVYTYSYGPGYYPNRSYGAYYGRGGYYGGYGGRGVSVRIGF
jgi:hypothetical protein